MTSSSLTLGPAQGRLLLRTGVEGRAARMGHRLTLGFADWQCAVAVTDGVPTSVVLEVTLPSLQVLQGEGGLKPLSGIEKKLVRDNALKTLYAKDHPLARWESSAVTPAGAGYELAGTLAISGQQHPCPVRVTVDGTHAVGTTTVRQTTWGIKPYAQMMGAMQVSDVVEVLVEATLPQD